MSVVLILSSNGVLDWSTPTDDEVDVFRNLSKTFSVEPLSSNSFWGVVSNGFTVGVGCDGSGVDVFFVNVQPDTVLYGDLADNRTI